MGKHPVPFPDWMAHEMARRHSINRSASHNMVNETIPQYAENDELIVPFHRRNTQQGQAVEERLSSCCKQCKCADFAGLCGCQQERSRFCRFLYAKRRLRQGHGRNQASTPIRPALTQQLILADLWTMVQAQKQILKNVLCVLFHADFLKLEFPLLQVPLLKLSCNRCREQLRLSQGWPCFIPAGWHPLKGCQIGTRDQALCCCPIEPFDSSPLKPYQGFRI